MLSASPPTALPSSALDRRPIEPQSHSPLLSLPPEIRNQIYSYLFPQDIVIVDPAFVEQKSLYCNTPQLNLALFSTCRQIYAEADLRPLFSSNVFRFTRATIAQAFLRQLPDFHQHLITDIELDVRDVDDQVPTVARSWIQCMFWNDSKWSDSFGSLKHDAPGLRTLRLNFSAWTIINTKRRELWSLLVHMMQSVRGLDSIMLIGCGRGSWMEKQDPWSPVHYVGSDSMGKEEVLEMMLAAVGNGVDHTEKLVTWERSRGRIQLQVAQAQHLLSYRKLPQDKGCRGFEDVLPPSGWCTAEAYNARIETSRKLVFG